MKRAITKRRGKLIVHNYSSAPLVVQTRPDGTLDFFINAPIASPKVGA